MNKKEAKQVSPHSVFLQNQRGQLTIFIIIAILIVAGIALFFTLKGTFQKGEVYAPEVEPIVNFIQECLDETAEEGISYLAAHGGYYDVPNPKKGGIPFYWYIDKSFIPSKEIIESEFSNYIEENLHNCIQDFKTFEGEYLINQGTFFVDSEFLLDKARIKLNYPLSINKEEFTGRLDNFNKDFNTNFYEKYLLVEEIIEEQENNPTSIPLGFISNLAYDNDFILKTVYLEEDVLMYFLIFNQGESDEFVYSFVVKYNWDGLI